MNGHSGGYAGVKYSEMIERKSNASLKQIIDIEGLLLAHDVDNTLLVNTSYHHLSGTV